MSIEENNILIIKFVSFNWLIDVYLMINWIWFLFGFLEFGDDFIWVIGERKGYFVNFFKSVLRWIFYFEENVFKVIFDGFCIKNYEVSIICCIYEICV